MVTAISVFIVEGSFTQIPVNTSALEGSTAQFTCTAGGTTGVTYLVNSTIGVTKSTVFSGNQTTLYLNVPVTRSMDNWPVVCRAFWPNGIREDSPPAYLHVQGLC